MTNRLEFVRVTEVGKFKECRRAWYLSEIRGLVPKMPQEDLWFGIQMHLALEELATSNDVQKAIGVFMAACNKSLPDLESGYGPFWDQMAPMYQEMVTLGRGMLFNYVIFDRSTDFNLETAKRGEKLLLEERFFVPIVSPSGRALKGLPQLSGKMDRVATRRGTNGEYIQDYKNSTRAWQEGRNLDLDDQTTGYHYGYWRVNGVLPDGMIYDTLLKRVPNEPRVLKSRKKDGPPVLSQDKDQGTTYELYLEAIGQMGLNPADYSDILTALREQAWTRYFKREVTRRNMEQIAAYERDLYFTFQDMRAVVQDPRKAYPSPSPMRCPRCPFRDVCLAMNDGSDSEDLIKARFTVSEEKRF